MLTSQELYERIDSLRIKKGMKIAELNTAAGISNGTLSSWKKRGTMPKLEILDSLCFALDVPLASILYDVNVDTLTGDEVELLADFKKLNEKQKYAIKLTIKNMNPNK